MPAAKAVPLATFLASSARGGLDNDLPSARAAADESARAAADEEQAAGTKYVVEWNGNGPLPLPPDVVKANLNNKTFTASNRLHTKPPASVEEFKAKLADLVLEYFDSADVMEVIRQLEELQMPRHHEQLVRRAIMLSLERSDREREMAAVLIASLHVRRIISSTQVFDAFITLLEMSADLQLDCPTADAMLAHFLADAVLDGCLTPTFILEPPPLSLRLSAEQKSAAERILGEAKGRLREGTALAAPTDALQVPLDVVKVAIESLVAEYLQASDLGEVSRRLREGQVLLPLRHEVVKRGVRVAMQRGAHECESVSRLISALYGATLPAAEVARGFEALVEEATDLALDMPETPRLLGNFIARAVSDEVLAASFIEHALRTKAHADDAGATALKRAKSLLAIGHSSHRMARIWGPRAMAASAPVEEVKGIFQGIVDEFYMSRDASEARSALAELGVVHSFHHEFAKKLLRRGVEGSTAERQMALGLLAQLTASAEPTVARESVSQGFERLAEVLSDLRLDTPNAEQILGALRADAVAKGIVAA
eukprot:CAMPEP_0179868094 /NCGR_PEP_ID=MMETSP0982-20121206/18599_1 /TAXON_ID=483367 /ORGANISM="non described non described, Strain CCMP 2436" /LENGTH=542 /DNA_ID=CAMNT_0021757655 /DNA_START=60 /DNA_END=1688 /DNA_ORIENTATION=+